MSDSLKLVRQLREITGAGILDCKKYLEQTNNNLDDAVKLFRTESGKKAEKKSSRIAAEGLVNYFENSQCMLILELNSETDFVAKDENFIALSESIAEILMNQNESDNMEAINSIITESISKLGENIKLRRYLKIDKNNNLYGYAHN
ncbi:MAG: translation elongation factor Ts, partial [Gammaproteobacteria bacterium]